MTSIAPMLGAIMGISKLPKAQDKKRAVKPKTRKNGGHTVTKGEKSVTSQGQQHGELASYKPPTDRQLIREHAKGAMRMATNDWVAGRISTKKHEKVHERAKHVISGRTPREFVKGS